MLITPVSTLDDWSNRADAISSISLRLALNSAFKSPVEPLRRAAKSLSAAMLIWHCTICCPFLIVNPNAIKSASYPTSLPRVSGMNLAFSPMVRWSGPQVGPPAKRLVLLPTVNGSRRAMSFLSMMPRSIPTDRIQSIAFRLAAFSMLCLSTGSRRSTIAPVHPRSQWQVDVLITWPV